jgi:hypothetical protein
VDPPPRSGTPSNNRLGDKYSRDRERQEDRSSSKSWTWSGRSGERRGGIPQGRGDNAGAEGARKYPTKDTMIKYASQEEEEKGWDSGLSGAWAWRSHHSLSPIQPAGLRRLSSRQRQAETLTRGLITWSSRRARKGILYFHKCTHRPGGLPRCLRTLATAPASRPLTP